MNRTGKTLFVLAVTAVLAGLNAWMFTGDWRFAPVGISLGLILLFAAAATAQASDVRSSSMTDDDRSKAAE